MSRSSAGCRSRGWQVNVPLLLGVVLAVALLDPSKPVPGTDLASVDVSARGRAAWRWWPCRCGSATSRCARRTSSTTHAIIEVAALFSGIFITMQPALQILGVRGDELGIHTPAQFFWATGSLSSVLDNAPTYLVFFKTAQAMPSRRAPTVAGVDEMILMGISLGAVFMGAMTYIGNGPNFMVRAIAEKSGVKMPSFFGYMVYSCLILLPLFALMMWLFFVVSVLTSCSRSRAHAASSRILLTYPSCSMRTSYHLPCRTRRSLRPPNSPTSARGLPAPIASASTRSSCRKTHSGRSCAWCKWPRATSWP